MSTDDLVARREIEAKRSDDGLGTHALAIISFIYNRVVAGAATALRRQVGLSVTEARIVLHVGAEEWKTANELSKNLALDKAAISRAVGRLIDLGLITSERDPNHAARNLLELTEVGQDRYRQIAVFTFAREDSLLGVLSERERRQFTTILQKILTNVETVNDRVAQGEFWD